jgi:hypothetical protein
MTRTLDIRLSEEAAKALSHLQRTLGCGKVGDALRLVVAAGVRPTPESFKRTEAVRRMRATVDDGFARDIAAVSAADGVPIERYLDALLREGARLITKENSCRRNCRPDTRERTATIKEKTGTSLKSRTGADWKTTSPNANGNRVPKSRGEEKLSQGYANGFAACFAKGKC